MQYGNCYKKLNYRVEVPINLTTAALDQYFLRGNSVFDPNGTGVGVQPDGFDELAARYRAYQVMGSTIRVRVVNLSGSAPAQIAVVPAAEITSLNSWTQVCIYPRSRPHKVIGLSTGGNNVKYFKSRFPRACAGRAYERTEYQGSQRMLGVDRAQFGNIEYQALVTANPSRMWNWIIAAAAVDGVTSINLDIVADVTYYVKFYRPKLQDQD